MTWHPDMPEEYKNQIVTGDARELAKRLPDESIDLIFTDPVYDRIEDYEWLARVAARVLKQDSACLVWSNPKTLFQSHNAMITYLSYAWLLQWQKYGVPRMGRTGVCVLVPCLWFEKGHSKRQKPFADWIGHPYEIVGNAKHATWNKPERVISHWLDKFDGCVFDPFAGGGTVPAVCKQLGRNYIAFEIDPETAELARERVRNTQPPLFVMEPEQLGLLDE